MTDRQIVYAGALPQTTDLLNTSKFAMLGDAYMAMAMLGNSATSPSTVVAGLACTPTTPASLQVNVGPGAIFSIDATDATAYGDLGTDSTQIYKMGTRPLTGTLTITPPSTSGYSQVFLVQAILSDIDGGSTTENYYNSANPSVPLTGPANAGTSQNTTRTCVCTIALKAGTAASTGTQTNPAPDTGYTALYYITVANGQTQITSANIVVVNGGFAPFVNTALPYVPSGVQAGGWVFAEDTGAASNLVATLAPIPTAYKEGMGIIIKAAAEPTGASVINVNGLGNKSIVHGDGSSITAFEWTAGSMLGLYFDGNNFQLAWRAGYSQPYLGAPTTYYVNGTTGSDSNNGLTSSTAFATIQKAINSAVIFNLNGYNVTIYVADGTYAPFQCFPINGNGNIIIIGNNTTPANCIIHSSTSAYNTTGSAIAGWGAGYVISGMALVSDNLSLASGPSGIGLRMLAAGQINIYNMNFGTCTYAHMTAEAGTILMEGYLDPVGSSWFIQISGNSPFHLYASGGQISLSQEPYLNILNAVTMTSFVNVTQSGIVYGTYKSITNASNVTGAKYSANLNGVINTLGAGTNYFPGTTAGTTSTGGQYA